METDPELEELLREFHREVLIIEVGDNLKRVCNHIITICFFFFHQKNLERLSEHISPTVNGAEKKKKIQML